ncbi:MAG: transposase [Planctomycetaceae bacterium]
MFHNRVAFTIAKAYPSAELIGQAGTKKLINCLIKEKIRVVPKTVDRIIAWSQQAAVPEDCFTPCTDIWQQYLVLHTSMSEQITQAERKIASFLAQTPYVLLLSIPGINVISAGELAGEAGPIEHYASTQAINGRAGLFPSCYQSDQVNRSGGVAWSCNRRLRAASILVAHNLIKCHPYYRGQAALMKSNRVATRDIECRIANRANRMVFQIVSGKQVWRGHGVDRDYLLKKLMVFHQASQTDATQIVKDLMEAAKYLPKSHALAEGQQLPVATVRPRGGTQSLGALLLPLLIRLGVATEKPLESNSSEV